MDSKNYSITFFDILAIVFIVLKLVKIINWSWWWVLSPIWMPIVLIIVIGLVVVLIEAIGDKL